MIDLPPTHGVVLCLVCLQGQGTLPLEQAPFAVMRALSACFSCLHWLDVLAQDQHHPDRVVIVDGSHYTIGDEDPRLKFRGFSGALFVIAFPDKRVVRTTNLWHQGRIPGHFRARFPKGARFVRDRAGTAPQPPCQQRGAGGTA